MKDEPISAVTDDLTNITTLEEEAKSFNSDDALLMSMGKKPELRRGECYCILLIETVATHADINYSLQFLDVMCVSGKSRRRAYIWLLKGVMLDLS
jgi:hypothetical protein